MRATKSCPPPKLTALLKYDGWFYGVYILGNGLSQTAVTGKETLDKPTTPDRHGSAAGAGDVVARVCTLRLIATSVIHEQVA